MSEQLPLSHPFDREEETSLQQLFTAFCNHLTLGQWELARVCLRGLFEQRDKLEKPLKEIMRAIIDQPHHASYGSCSVPSPFHLSWLCLVEYLDLFTDEEDQIPEPIVKKVEFRLLLYLACQNAPQVVIQDIDDYHSQIVYRDPDLFASGVSDLPSSTLSYLKQLLSESPQFGHAVINDLTSKGKGFLKNNQLLQQLYLDLINEQLMALDSGAVEVDGTSTTSVPKDDMPVKCATKECKFIYQMLSYMDPSPEMLSLSKCLDDLFRSLIIRSSNERDTILDRGILYSCFLSQTSTYLMEKFCFIENQMRFALNDRSELPLSRATLQRFKQPSALDGLTVNICYAQSFMEDRREAWKFLFFHALNGNHILENMVETALVFIRESDFARLTQLLSPVEFSRLKPLVLLLGWPYCYSCENAKNLLEALWDPAEKAAHPSLHQACQKLAYQVQLVQWCTEKARPLLASSEPGSTRHQQASEMFQGLESHSVLHVLHKSISLAHLPEKEVFELLRKRPVFTPLKEDGNEPSGEGSEERLDEKKTEGGREKVSKEDLDQNSEIHPEVQRDVFLYHSYCALRNFMEAVTSSVETSGELSLETKQVLGEGKSVEPFNSGGSEYSDTNSEESCPEERYCGQVRNKLDAGKYHLAHVYPLTYRVEILENIFSLLFTTYEDLYEGRTHHNESDDVEAMDEETRSLSKSSRTGSWESLASSLDLSLDVHGPHTPAKDQEKAASLTGSQPPTPDTLRQKSPTVLSTMDSPSRRQLFKNNRAESDSALLKKSSDREAIAPPVSPPASNTVRARLSDEESYGGNLISSKGSSRAVVEEENDLKYEFVIEDATVPDMLTTLKECLMELNTAKFNELKKEKSESFTTRQDFLQTSVPRNSMEQRISRLGQFINEAQWRFQLVSWKNASKGQITRNSKKRLSRKIKQIVRTDEKSKEEDAEDEDSDDVDGATMSRKSGQKAAVPKETSGESSSSVHLSQDISTGTENNKEVTRRRKSRHRRLTSRTSASEGCTLLIKDDSVIARMLSSPDTLIYMCMRKDNYERALQVIKMFNMAEKPSAQALAFAEKYSKTIKHLESLQPKGRRVQSQGLFKSRKPLGGLGAVAMAAASGASNSMVSNLIDELLAMPSLSAVLDPSLTPENLANGNSTLVKFMDPEMVPTMLCVDLASTAAVSWSVCKTLLDMGKSRITEEPHPSSSKSSGILRGIKPFMHQLEELLNQELSRGNAQDPSGGITISVTPKPNAVDLLLVGTHPIRPKDMEAHRKLNASQEESFRRFEQALEEGETQIRSVDEVAKQHPGHRHVGRQASFNLMEKGLAVRVAMIELKKAFDCIDSANYVTTAGGGGLEQRYDYISSLVKHVETLATLLLFWKSKAGDSSSSVPPNIDLNRPGALKVSNPFVVLNEGIAETLGRHMFEKDISPESLEPVARQLHVNLSKVIVYNCCPAVPSHGGISRRDVRWPSSDLVILNTGSRWTENVRDPNTVSNDLLSRMIKLLKDVAEKNSDVVDSNSVANITRTPEFQAISRGTAELQCVDLDSLSSDDAKVCFYLNTLNLLIAHASLIQFSDSSGDGTSEAVRSITRHASFSRLMDAMSSSGGEEKVGDAVPLTALERIAFLKQQCYCIGQLGVVSAFDLQFVILHRGLVPPSTFGEGVVMCFPERFTDNAKKYKLTTPERRVIFAICDGCVSSPKLQSFDVDELDAQLSIAVVSYINSRVSLNQQTGQITLPEILHWYRKDFEMKSMDDFSNASGAAPDVSLLLQMEPYLFPDTAAVLQQMLPNIAEITFTPFCWSFGYRFDSVMRERSSSVSSLQRSNSMPENLLLSMELSVLAQTRLEKDGKRGLFSLNETALEYLEEKSPLVAALTSLVCSSPAKLNILSEERSQFSKETLESGVDTTDFPFRFALEKTANFPCLQRYIASKLYTIADMLTLSPADSNEQGGSFDSYDFIKLDPNLQTLQDGMRPPDISLFSVALASEGSSALQNAILKASDFFLRKGYFEELLELICSSDLRGDGVAGPSIDFLLSSAVLSKGGTRSNLQEKLRIIFNQLKIPELKFGHVFNKKLWVLLTRMKDHDELTRLVLRKLKEWKADTCIDLIDLCLSRSVNDVARRNDLERKRKEISLHQKISLCVKSFKLQVPAEERESSSAGLKRWQGVASMSEENPSVVMEFLLSAQQFDLASEWAHLHNLPPKFHKTITESHLKFLLGNNPEEQMKAYKILEGVQDSEMTHDICESLMAQNLHVSQTLFIIQFMLTNIPSLLSPVRVEKLLCTKMGAKALLCLPDSARPHYEHLVSRPPLLLEQLLMNMKVEWAAKVFQRIQIDLSCMEDVESLGNHGCTVKAFDELLSTYSAKALEFQVVQTEKSQTKEMCSSIMQSLIQAPSSSPSTPVSFLESGRYTPVTSVFGTRDTTVGNVEKKVQTAPRRKISHESRSVTLQKKTASSRATGSLGTRRSAYIPPVVPPKMEDWMPDQQVSLCVICQERFSMFNRRHHCRRCGRVVCGTCSQHNHVVEGYGRNPVRVCGVCHEYFFTNSSSQEDLSTSVHSESASLGPGRSSQEHTVGSGPDNVSRSYLEETTSLSYLTEDMNAKCLWKLGLDEETNSSLRDEFYYEQAPSASLCVSILDLHSDVKACGKLILDLCNSLSQKLVPVAPGISNEELDPYLLISMIRYLLFNAKLKMMKTGETQGVELCDTYLGHVDLMKFLVESNCGDIPSLRDLMRQDSARRLRDRFIEAERLSLAMEVSTKCGLDPSGVWGAAGFALLKAGDFTGAREKFSRCMKPEEGGKQQQQYNSQYLEKIIEILQSSPLLAYRQSTDDLMSPFLGLLEHGRNFQRGDSYLDPKRFDECLHYLHTYGSPSSLVAFYVRHGHLKLACRYILDQQCSVEVFIESLFMRLVIKGKFALLKEQMEITDPTLQAWMPYLTAACKFLLRRSFHNLLYEVQVFMRDFFRAAQTCIRFYEGVAGGPVTSYEDLYSRLHYLEEAKQHIETVIAEKKSPKGTLNTVFAYLRQRSTGSVKSVTEEPSHFAMSLSELNSHLNTINLQIEVTNFMHQCAVERGGPGLLRASEGSRLPTLFGNGHVRGDMVVQVLLAGTSIQDGFSLASRIIQDYNLPAARVYVDTGRSLARQYKYSLIEELLHFSGETGQVTDKCHDDIILACVSIVAADQSQAKYLEGLIKHLKTDINKISAFIMCGKLKSAYLIAVQGNRVDAIREIADVAEKSGQSKMVEICCKFLTQYEKQRAATERRTAVQRKHGAESNR